MTPQLMKLFRLLLSEDKNTQRMKLNRGYAFPAAAVTSHIGYTFFQLPVSNTDLLMLQ